MDIDLLTAASLKPCPFCGNASTLVLSIFQGNERIECSVFVNDVDGCGAMGSQRSSTSRAIDAWNLRTT